MFFFCAFVLCVFFSFYNNARVILNLTRVALHKDCLQTFCGKTQFPQSFGWAARNSAENMRFHKTPKKIRCVLSLSRMDWVIFYISVDISCCMDLEEVPIKKLWSWNSTGESVNPSIINISFHSLKTFFPHENLRHMSQCTQYEVFH